MSSNKSRWGTRLGLILAMAGNSVGLNAGSGSIQNSAGRKTFYHIPVP